MLSLLVIAVYTGSGGGVEEGEEGEAAGAVHRPHLGDMVWEYVIRGNTSNLQCLDKSTDTTSGQLTVTIYYRAHRHVPLGSLYRALLCTALHLGKTLLVEAKFSKGEEPAQALAPG